VHADVTKVHTNRTRWSEIHFMLT